MLEKINNLPAVGSSMDKADKHDDTSHYKKKKIKKIDASLVTPLVLLNKMDNYMKLLSAVKSENKGGESSHDIEQSLSSKSTHISDISFKQLKNSIVENVSPTLFASELNKDSSNHLNSVDTSKNIVNGNVIHSDQSKLSTNDVLHLLKPHENKLETRNVLHPLKTHEKQHTTDTDNIKMEGMFFNNSTLGDHQVETKLGSDKKNENIKNSPLMNMIKDDATQTIPSKDNVTFNINYQFQNTLEGKSANLNFIKNESQINVMTSDKTIEKIMLDKQSFLSEYKLDFTKQEQSQNQNNKNKHNQNLEELEENEEAIE